MARSLDSPILAQLRSAKTHVEQATALQGLKNEIIGHLQKKEAWVAVGALEPIVETLSSSRLASESNGKDARAQPWRSLSDEDGVKLQALQLITSFASDGVGGPPFLAPLHATHAVPTLLSNNFSPLTNPPQIVLAALKALTEIVNAAAFASDYTPLKSQVLADSLFLPQNIESLHAILSITPLKQYFKSHATLACGLISRLCQEERHQQALTEAGLLDCLATQLAQFAVRDGFVVPGAEEMAYSDGLYEVFPGSAHVGTSPGPILGAIVAIVGDSKYRANRLVNSPALLAIFPAVRFHGHRGVRQVNDHVITAMELILPAIPVRSQVSPGSGSASAERSDGRAASRTPLHRYSSANWDSARNQAQGSSGGELADDIESPLIPWLIHLVRTLEEGDRLMAAAVLAALTKARLGRKMVRETSIGLLVVPILVHMIAKNDEGQSSERTANATGRLILETAPTILARLMSDSKYLQTTAYDCGAIKVLTKLLRGAYEPMPQVEQARYWSPQPGTDDKASSGHEAANSLGEKVGDGTPDIRMVHRVRVREASLKALSAVCADSEEYRKALVAEDCIPYVVESLCEYPRKPRQAKEWCKDGPDKAHLCHSASPSWGTNSNAVIIAACHVTRTMSRSVSNLRTALADFPIALTIMAHMHHWNDEVKVAATAAMVNLVVDFSPVREVLTAKGVMEVLCRHAHSDNASLRINALWALKHFVDGVGPDVKKTTLQLLQPNWLLRVVSDGSQDWQAQIGRMKETADDEADEEMDKTQAAQDQPVGWVYWSNGSFRELDVSRSTRMRQAEEKLAAMREAEVSTVRQARIDALALQEQGLDFIRNLIGRPGSHMENVMDTAEMIDHVLMELGQERLFEILESKMRPRLLRPWTRRTTRAVRESRVLHPQPRVIVAAIYVLVHIAASVPRHRQMIMAQTELLKLLVQQASSKESDVRTALCYLVINLTSPDEDGEARRATLELRRLGFHIKMDALKLHDRELDVRERAKTAVNQLEHMS